MKQNEIAKELGISKSYLPIEEGSPIGQGALT
jgi:DNA-binding XRE family transcriptional regulator